MEPIKAYYSTSSRHFSVADFSCFMCDGKWKLLACHTTSVVVLLIFWILKTQL